MPRETVLGSHPVSGTGDHNFTFDRRIGRSSTWGKKSNKVDVLQQNTAASRLVDCKESLLRLMPLVKLMPLVNLMPLIPFTVIHDTRLCGRWQALG